MDDDKKPKNYRHLVDGNFIDEIIISDRYKNRFEEIQSLLEKYGLDDCCIVNPRLLWFAILSYFEDIARLKNFHEHQYVQPDKIYAYEVFWYLRNNVIQIVKQDTIPEEYLHVNEYVFSFWLLKNISTELESRFKPNIQIDDFITKLEEHELIVDFRQKLFYTFKYRSYTAQSLFLMVEAFMAAAEFTLEIT